MATQRVSPTTGLRLFLLLENILRGIALIAVLVFLIEYGFYLLPRQRLYVQISYGILAGIFLAGSGVQLLLLGGRWRTYLKENPFKYVMSLLMLIGFLAMQIGHWLGFGEFIYAYETLLKLYLLTNIWQKFIKFSQYLAQFNTSPARFIVISFGSAILIGAGLLMLPKATTIPFHFLDALFTSTSAICVTGLIVVDTATAFTRTGQLVILGLIQLGGLGIMTVTAFFSLIIGQRMTRREQVLIGNVLSTDRPAQLGDILKVVFLTTIAIEACGMVVLYASWHNILSPELAWYTALFHAVSAFCNAGFSTFSDSLMGFATGIPVNLVICTLIILGGLGFRTLRDLKSLFSRGSLRQKIGRISVQSKVILMTAGLLLLTGTLVFFVTEFSNTFQGQSLGHRILMAFFQSVTCRTAGFNTVDMAKLHPSSAMFSILLMFIGAAPGSTGGGIKVTTVAILLGTVVASARGKTRLELFRRTIPVKVLYQTLVVITVYLVMAVLVSFLLSITEHHSSPVELIFETISALGTVGLSTGVTSQLSVAGKILIIITMFLGRIGPFTLALAIGQRQLRESYNYPEEEVQIG